MSLLTSEVQRIKVELGYNALTLSALPYALDGITQIFEQVVQPYLQGGALTYSSTPVTAVPVTSSPASAVLTVVSAVGISVGDRAIVDTDGQQEFAHVSVVTGGVGGSITVALSNAHAGTYPVNIEGGESIVREYLNECITISQRISIAGGRVGISKVDEVTFYSTKTDQTGMRGELLELQRHWRNELASALGVPNLREQRGDSTGGGGLMESY